MTVDSREFGIAQAKIDNLERMMQSQHQDIREIRKVVGGIETSLATQRGAWKSVAWIAGLIGAVVTTLVSALVKKLIAQGLH